MWTEGNVPCKTNKQQQKTKHTKQNKTKKSDEQSQKQDCMRLRGWLCSGNRKFCSLIFKVKLIKGKNEKHKWQKFKIRRASNASIFAPDQHRRDERKTGPGRPVHYIFHLSNVILASLALTFLTKVCNF